MNSLFLTTKELSPEEVESLNSEFELALSNPTAREELTNALDKNLRDFSVADDYTLRMSYFRWYTRLIWRYLTVLSPDIMVSVAIGRQIPMAIRLDFDVVQEIILYLNVKADNEEEMSSLFLKIKNTFLKSKAVVGVWNNQEITVAEIVEEFFSIKKRGSDSLELAECNSKLQEMLFPKSDPLAGKYFFADPSIGTYRFVQTMLFFYMMEPKNIWYAVDVFMHPEREAGEGIVDESVPVLEDFMAASVEQSTLVNPEIVPVLTNEKPELSMEAAPVVPPPVSNDIITEPPTVEETPVVEPQSRLTTEQIKSQIESAFKKDSEGNFEDMAGVMSTLNEIAEKNNDPMIAEMIYFDEQTGKFVWKE